jgi:hypothetical protein
MPEALWIRKISKTYYLDPEADAGTELLEQNLAEMRRIERELRGQEVMAV